MEDWIHATDADAFRTKIGTVGVGKLKRSLLIVIALRFKELDGQRRSEVRGQSEVHILVGRWYRAGVRYFTRSLLVWSVWG